MSCVKLTVEVLITGTYTASEHSHEDAVQEAWAQHEAFLDSIRAIPNIEIGSSDEVELIEEDCGGEE